MLRKCLLFFLFLTGFLMGFSQSPSPDSLLREVSDKYPLEKIYVHFDKEAYLAGETIWFKAYLLSGNKPSQTSSMLCVEWLNDSGRLMQKKVFPLINSSAAGSFEIPPGLGSMVTTVRAYTKSMMNLGLEGLYQHRLHILSADPVKSAGSEEKEYRVYFLPEGGNLISGISNRVAVKVTDQWGYPVNAEGLISDDKGKEILRFSTSFLGMGSFNLTPEAGAAYFAQCSIGGIPKMNIKLPAVKLQGVMLQAERLASGTYVKVNSETVYQDQLLPAYILGVMENTVVFSIPIPAGTRNVKAGIPMEQLPTGILQLTVFTAAGEPLSERLVFVHNNDYRFGATLKADLLDLSNRKKNEFSLTLDDTLNASFSVSVTDADNTMTADETDNIYSGLLLTGELKGYIHNPRYYFEADDEAHRQNLDLLMMTNGWRRFSWDEILSKRVPPIRYKDDGYIRLAGTVYNSDRTDLIRQTTLSVFIKSRNADSRMVIVPVDSLGQFNMTGMIYEDTATFYLQLAEGKKRKPLIELSSQSVINQFTLGTPLFASPLRSLTRGEIADRVRRLNQELLSPDFSKKAITLSEVKFTVRSKSPMQLVEEKYVKSPLFSSYSTKTLDLVNDPQAKNISVNIFEYLKGRLSSVTITGSMGNYFLNFRNSMSLFGGKIPMDLYLNEVPSNSLQISTIPVNQVALVKVYPQGFIGGAGNSPGGALAIFTKSGSDMALLPGTDQAYQFGFQGFSAAREFFSPDYSQVNIAEKDTRTTLYWNPYLRTDPNDKACHFSFYNNDRTRRIRVVLEGMSEDGRLLRIEKILEK